VCILCRSFYLSFCSFSFPLCCLSEIVHELYITVTDEIVHKYVTVRTKLLIFSCVFFVDHFICPFVLFLFHCVVCPSLIYGFWLPLWYLQTLPRYYVHLYSQLNNVLYYKRNSMKCIQRSSKTNPTKNRMWTQLLRKG
jgi:hypothetical protein